MLAVRPLRVPCARLWHVWVVIQFYSIGCSFGGCGLGGGVGNALGTWQSCHLSVGLLVVGVIIACDGTTWY